MSDPSAIPEDVMKAAQAVVRGLWDRDRDSGENAEAVARAVMAECERAAKVCEDQAQQFLSPQYASNQPLGSFCERFACEECATAIRKGAP